MSAVLVDIFADIVARVSGRLRARLTEYDPTVIGVNYMHGAPLQIEAILQSWNGVDSRKKYPLVALYQPFEETKGTVNGLDGIDNVRIIIARQSDNTWLPPQRYDINFRPVLYPVYDALLDEMQNEPRLQGNALNEFNHTKTDWPYWTDNDKNPLKDYLDIIEIKNMKLSINTVNCK